MHPNRRVFIDAVLVGGCQTPIIVRVEVIGKGCLEEIEVSNRPIETVHKDFRNYEGQRGKIRVSRKGNSNLRASAFEILIEWNLLWIVAAIRVSPKIAPHIELELAPNWSGQKREGLKEIQIEGSRLRRQSMCTAYK